MYKNPVDLLRNELDFHSSAYDNLLLLRDFEMTDSSLKDFCQLHLPKNLIKTPLASKILTILKLLT